MNVEHRTLNIITDRITQSVSNLKALLADENTLKNIADTAQLIVGAIKSGNKLMICGNGGSAADAQHIAGEFVCRFYKDMVPLLSIAFVEHN